MTRITVLALALLAAGAARAQSVATVTEIVIEQEGARIADPLVASLIEARVGQPLEMRQVRETLTHLMTLGRYDDVQVFRDTVPGGVRLRFALRPLHPLDRLELRGALGLAEDEVRRAVTSRFGAVPAEGRIEDVRRGLETFYRGRGFTTARVTASVEPTHNPDRASLVLQVQAGPRARVVAVDLETGAATERANVLAELDIRAGVPYDADAITGRLTRYETDLHNRGYYEARATHTVRFEADGAHVNLIVDTGPQVTVTFDGDPLPEADRDRLVPIRSQMSVDQDLLEDSTRAIEDHLRARGYRDALATYERVENATQLRVTFTVQQGRRHIIDRIVVEGSQEVPAADVLVALGVTQESVFVQDSLDRGVNAVRGLYRLRGYTRTDVRADIAFVVVPGDEDRRATVTITLIEGPRTLVGTIAFTGGTQFAEATLRTIAALTTGRPFTQGDVDSAQERLEVEYRDRGFDAVSIEPRVRVSDDERTADITFAVVEGPQAIVDHVIIVGARRTRPAIIERELTVRPGQPLGASALAESQQRLAGLGLFRRIQVTTVTHAGESRRDVIVTVDEAPPTTLGYGGGVESGLRLRPTGEGGQAEERFEVAPRGFFEIGRRNLWGKNRAVNLFGRVSLRSRDVVLPDGTTPAALAGQGGYGFNEYRLYGTFREPRLADTRADLLITGIVNQAVRSSFNFITREARAEAGLRAGPTLSLAARYSFEQTRLFDQRISADEKPLIDRLFPQVRLSGLSASALRDTRDDGLYPNRGTFTVVDGEVAARGLGSEVGYLKTFVQFSAFRPLPANRRMILALSGRLGAARGFSRTVDVVDANGVPVLDAAGGRVQQVVQDLPASKRFFAGGDTTVRGFSLDRLGDAKTISPTGFPTGGNGEIIMNAELRVGVLRNRAELVGFLDAGNIFQRASDLDLTNLRAASGVGLRYRSPVGPIRVDLGFNLDRRELVPGQLERPYVLNISLGQAF